MEQKLIIYESDVYKAKTQERYKESDIFASSYRRAADVLRQIIIETEEYRDNCRNNEYENRYLTMGNNIIAFCAERGGGKTSAMLSFSKFLSNVKENELLFPDSDAFKFSEYRFQILDPIDPSSLNYGEPIVRVLVSRLFELVSKLIENGWQKDEKEFRRCKKEVLHGFQQCYNNVDYIRGNKKDDVGDLETLARLGNSANLKKNLNKLIEEILRLDTPMYDKKSHAYLVVQIDDSDLSMGDIFEICEDIRNYFSIPNVIVLMAVSYEQLSHGIHQKYLKQYDNIVKMHPDSEFQKQCAFMAAKYLEKMLPSGHIISLSNTTTSIVDNNLKLFYIKSDGREILGDVENVCQDTQEQLLRLLYQKTRIIFFKRLENHPFLPRTLRELGHFVKFLEDMEDIGHLSMIKNMEEMEQEFEKLKRNIAAIHNYFINYWCGARLPFEQRIKLVEWDKKIERYGIKNLHSELQDLRNEYPVLKEALSIYMTIQMNQLFIKALSNRALIMEIIKYIEKVFNIQESIRLEKRQLFHFKMKPEEVNQYYLSQIIDKEEDRLWLQSICRAVDNMDTNTDFFDKENRSALRNKCSAVVFDSRNLLFSFLLNEEITEMISENIELLNIDEKNEFEKKSWILIYFYIKNIFANEEVWEWILSQMKEKYNDNGKLENEDIEWKAYLQEFYDLMDKWIGQEANYLGCTSEIGKLCNYYLQKGGVYERIYWCSEDNRRLYVRRFDKFFKKKMEQVKKQIKRRNEEGEWGSIIDTYIEEPIEYHNIIDLRYLNLKDNEIINEINEINELLKDAEKKLNGRYSMQSSENSENDESNENNKNKLENLESFIEEIETKEKSLVERWGKNETASEEGKS